MPAESKAVALVRLNISDVHEDPSKQLLSDTQIQTLLDHYDGSTNRASARALRIIAASEALIGKKIRTQELSSDGPAVATSLSQLADVYTREADEEEAAAEGGFFIVPNTPGGDRLETEEYRRGGVL